MISYWIFVPLFVNVVLSLQCKRAWPPNCISNSTCQYNITECTKSLNNRGGTYCTTIIKKVEDQILIGTMDCIYDQETTKTCQNQTECSLKYTNSQKQFLHCCCNQHLCNFNFTLSDPDPLPSTHQGDYCQGLLCTPIAIFLLCLILALMILILILSLLYRKKLFKWFNKCGGDITKPYREKSNDNGENERFIENIDQKKIPFNHLFIGNIVKRGRFSSIHQGIYQNNKVAIKILLNQNPNDESRILFEHEKQIYSQPFMTHTNILKYYGYSECPDKFCLITELCERGSLVDVLRSRLLNDENELMLILKQICSGVQYLHTDYRNRNGLTRPPIAHRDLKSENILYFNSSQIVLCDFAMSTIIEQNENGPNQEQQIGTPRYMSPEMLVGTIGCEKDALLKCDVYALGIVFWEVLSRYPFQNCDGLYFQPFEKQLIENNLNVNNPTVNDMLKILSLSKVSDRRPLINPLWKCSNLSWLNQILQIMEDCWEQTPEGRISSGVVENKIQKIII